MGDPFRGGPGIGGVIAEAARTTRNVIVRDGRLYEGDVPLRVRSNADGLFVGCTFVTWTAWEELEKRVARVRGQE